MKTPQPTKAAAGYKPLVFWHTCHVPAPDHVRIATLKGDDDACEIRADIPR